MINDQLDSESQGQIQNYVGDLKQNKNKTFEQLNYTLQKSLFN